VEYEVLHEIVLDARHGRTGFTGHFRNGQPLLAPSKLQIVRFPGDEAVHLIHLDSNDVEQTDTWHESVVDAREQARLEFGVEPEQWT
jgi:hypothetical protein